MFFFSLQNVITRSGLLVIIQHLHVLENCLTFMSCTAANAFDLPPDDSFSIKLILSASPDIWLIINYCKCQEPGSGDNPSWSGVNFGTKKVGITKLTIWK